jgi:hypothetical protein
MPAPQPHVTCVVTAHNHERFVAEAVASALRQDYPSDRLDVVVVNDGSTDATARVLDDRFGDNPRVRIIHQENRGFVGAMNRALGEARGELVAILDGDDMWPLDKLSRQVPVLVARPEVGLVHGDMEVVDARGDLIHTSFFAYSRFDVRRGHVLGRLVAQNFVSGGASVFRRGFLDGLLPMPDELLYPDWYIAAGIAERAEIDHVDGSVNQYRRHDANMGLGGTGAKFFSDMRNNVRIQRWMLGNLDTSREPVAELFEATAVMLTRTERAALELGVRATEIHVMSPEQRAAADACADEARAALDAGRLDDGIRRSIDALALNPFDGAARADLTVAAARRERLVASVARGGGVPATRDTVVVALAGEIAATPELLTRYAQAVSDADAVTLMIAVAPDEANALTPALTRAAEAAGLEADGAADVLLHACESPEELLLTPLRAVYTRGEAPAGLAACPGWMT